MAIYKRFGGSSAKKNEGGKSGTKGDWDLQETGAPAGGPQTNKRPSFFGLVFLGGRYTFHGGRLEKFGMALGVI